MECIYVSIITVMRVVIDSGIRFTEEATVSWSHVEFYVVTNRIKIINFDHYYHIELSHLWTNNTLTPYVIVNAPQAGLYGV